MKRLASAAIFCLFVFSWSAFARAESVSGVKAIVLPHWYHHDKGPSRLVRLEFVGGKLSAPASAAVQFEKKRFVQKIDPGGKALGVADVYLPIENPKKSATAQVELKIGAKTLKTSAVIAPQRKWEIHLIHQTHLDIGFTHTQEQVLKRQVDHLSKALQYIEASKDYPEEARFKWHPEGMWAVDEFLRTGKPEEKKKFIEAARKGYIHQDVLYAQAMTGVYSEEELFELMGSAKRFEKKYGVAIVSAMQTDVPGYTWGLAAALGHNGVKYMSVGPNWGHRVGHTFAWGDKPFYWVSPSGKHRVLFWMAGRGYSWFMGRTRPGHKINPDKIFGYLRGLESKGYPYDLVQVRYSIGADNGPPNPALPDFVKQWNEKYAYPRMIVSRNSEMFKELEKRYKDKIPVISGDFTPYWEDGVASTSSDTAVNRRACEKIVQAQVLWAMLNPGKFPCEDFDRAWTRLIMYDEHTWGAHCSISRPDSPFSVSQAKYKQKFALDGATMTDELVQRVVGEKKNTASNTIDVYNTTSWARKRELVVLGRKLSAAGDVVKDAKGKVVSSQRLASGELAFVAVDVPPFGARRYTIHAGKAAPEGNAKAGALKLENELISLEINPQSGAIKSLRHKGIPVDLVDSSKGQGINDYLYILGRNAAKGHNRIKGPVKVTLQDAGPLVATMAIRSDAPGCKKLTRKIRIVSGSNLVECLNITDKLQERKPEGVYFAYPLNIPGGAARLDIPWAIIQPEKDQMTGANRNYYCIQRWVDISNKDYGVTWVTIDAPMMQFDPIRIAGARNARDWRTKIEPAQTFYSWVMNNHWETNYKAYQEGTIAFRYILAPHAHGYDAVEAQQVARGLHQPLLAFAADPSRPAPRPMLTVDGKGAIVTSLKPARDGKALMVRLFNTSGRKCSASLKWAIGPKETWISNPMEAAITKAGKGVEMAPREIVTLRVVR